MQSQNPLRRREFLRRAAIGAGALGAVSAIGVAAPVLGSLTDDDEESTAAAISGGSRPMVAYVRDLGAGDVVLMAGTTEVVVRDRVLASRLARGLASSADADV